MNFKYLLLVSYILLSAILGCKNPEYPLTIPNFSMTLPGSNNVFHSKDIPFGKTSVIIWFDPACRDCQEETEYILANMDKFAAVDFYLVTKYSYQDMMVFHDHLRLDTCRNITIGIDTTRAIPKHFKIRSTPLTVVLNNDKIVREVFSGKPDMQKFTTIVNHKL
ncbi:hypothetical protein [uncultured Chitinophaga sp.]|uniref:peroxiredoxin family protein n=1 Tax=uncultured Chitinophaga sp. TaxID=339340 RepID=UPI0025D66C34|nr:hypothetical protein [uncultured Chitinophaga sp.]